ncbi:AlbA family DNA-binding domain-containing protein [Desulfothermus sp.]
MGECINIEFKESKKALNKDVYQTICAFLNRIGGHILLGVKDNGKIVGIDPEFVINVKVN